MRIDLGLGPCSPARRKRTTGASPPPATLAYLPPLTTAGASYHTLVSNERLLAGYAGPLTVVGNGIGTAGLVVLGAGATGVGAADLPVAVSSLYGWFDQTGNGHDVVQDTRECRPHLRAEATIGGRLAAAFWGIEARAGARTSMAATQSLPAGNRTEIWVIDPSYSIQNAVFAEHGSGGAALRQTYIAPDAGGVLRAAGATTGVRIAAQPQVWIVVEGPGGSAVFVNGVRNALPAGGGGSIAQTTIGWSPGSGIASTANMRLAAYGSIAGAIGEADALAITAALTRRFAIVSDFALNLVHVGDSIVEGVNATDTIGLKAQMLPLIADRTRYLNLGVSGRTQAQCFSSRDTYERALFVPGRRNVALIDSAINDLCFGSEGAALYASTTTPYVAALKAIGYRVGVVTALPQNSTAYGVPVSAATVEERRSAYNAAVRGNAAGADFVVDRAGDDRVGRFPDSCNDPALYPDALHPSTACYAMLAPVYAAAINGSP